MRRVNSPDDIPDGDHYAVLVYKTTSTHVPGDERSRSNPGHGYPAHTVTNTSFEHWVTQDESLLQKKVESLSKPPRFSYSEPDKFVVLRVAKKLNVTTRTTVSLS